MCANANDGPAACAWLDVCIQTYCDGETNANYDAFAEQFSAAAASQFGSGWAWLVLEGSEGKIVTTGNADTPLTTAAKPLLALDVWEHAYYLDHRNDRGAFIRVWLEKLVSWDFANANL